MTSTPQRALVNGFHPRLLSHHGQAMTRDQASNHGATSDPDEALEDPIHLSLQQRWAETQTSIATLFDSLGQSRVRPPKRPAPDSGLADNAPTSAPAPPKKAARVIDEDDYGDDEDEEEEDSVKESPLKAKGKTALPNGIVAPAVRSPLRPGTPSIHRTATATSEQAKSSDDVRRQLDEDKRAAAEAAKKSFQSMFFTFENDRDAMLEQQKLDELDRMVENEMSGGASGMPGNQQNQNEGGASLAQGTLGAGDMGATQLHFKYLLPAIDKKRHLVRATDERIHATLKDVKKGRSKWHSEDKVGQEELYEAAERVLIELKAMTEYVQPFLQRVSKREAPDYHNVIKHPMDLGSMIKKLKGTAYKSKKEFVDDLSLIWSNCLKYNQDPAHPLRKKALYMRKETDKLTPLIPDVVVRDRAEVEAEERRLHSVDADDSDDDDAPIMASRGRKAPKKGGKGGPSSTKRAPTVAVEDSSSTPAPESKPALHASASHLRNEYLRAESEVHDASSTGFNTPPPGNATPLGLLAMNGITSGAPGSQADVTEVDIPNSAMSAQEDPDEEDTEFKTWKQVTKKDRAQAASERNRLFRKEKLNPDEPALLRSKAMMRRWMRQQKMNALGQPAALGDAGEDPDSAERAAQGESLAEGMEKDEDSTLPDYYTSLSAIPDLQQRWKWTTDSEGFAAPPHMESWMRMYPKDQFTPAKGALNNKMHANMLQMQETRKVCAKIGIVKQMQIQAQTYQNQFQKYELQPLLEQDIGPAVVSEEGPLMTPWLCRKALTRSVGKIFYHAGFEDFQPSALDAITNLAEGYFSKLIETFKVFREEPRQESFTFEEQALHTMHENGVDLESLETYVKDDVERLSTKLGVVHERMKSHLADLLRPALGDNAGADGAGAFNDGSEQFVGGDFAQDLEEDFFGFRELGLTEEFGLESLSVPLHLLQNRMHSAYQNQHQGPVIHSGTVFEAVAPYEPISMDTLANQIGLVQDYFREKLRDNHDEPLVEDEDLPQKQRFPKPRLPPTGKISSPRKRPIKEQQQAAKKKKRMEENGEDKAAGKNGPLSQPTGKLRLEMPEPKENGIDPEKDGETNANGTSMISPESLTAN